MLQYEITDFNCFHEEDSVKFHLIFLWKQPICFRRDVYDWLLMIMNINDTSFIP